MAEFDETADMPIESNHQKSNHRRKTAGFPQSMRTRTRPSRHALWKSGIRNYRTKESCWRQLQWKNCALFPHMISDNSALVTVAE
eukprot:7688562-Pyramimonas_sp.AAC.1